MYKVIDDSIDLENKTVKVYDSELEDHRKYNLYKTNKGYYINYKGKREYILINKE